MKKKIMYAVAFVALAAVAGWNYQQNQKEVAMSDLTLENIEALASGEGSSDCTRECPYSGYMCIINFTNGTSISCPGRWP